MSFFSGPAGSVRAYRLALVGSLLLWALATLFGWVNMVAYVSHLSQLALSLALLAPLQAARVEAQMAESNK